MEGWAASPLHSLAPSFFDDASRKNRRCCLPECSDSACTNDAAVQLLGHDAAASNERRPRHSGANEAFSQTYVDGSSAISWREEFQPKPRLPRSCLIYCSGFRSQELGVRSQDPMMVYISQCIAHSPSAHPLSVSRSSDLEVEKYLRTLTCGDWTH